MMKVLVVDSGAFIKAVPLDKWSSCVVTIKEVVAEVKDENTRRRLQVLPYELHFKEPTQESLCHVTNFAKKTGDYGSLSAVDMKVIALTYQMACEHEPEQMSKLREKPLREEPTSECVRMPGMVGFYKSKQKAATDIERTGTAAMEGADTADTKTIAVGGTNTDTEENTVAVGGADTADTNTIAMGGTNTNTEENTVAVGGADTYTAPVDADVDGDEEGWITPDNFEEVCAEMGGAVEETAAGVTVGCVTTDFAMQNVLMQMGLAVISVEGLRIKKLKTYAKKCKACFRTTTNTGLQFCPHCGNRTLAKVSVSVGEDGTLRYQFLSEKQFSHKGLRHSIPPPKGGRHANNPVLAPDQKVTYKERRSRRGNMNPLHPDYIAQSSPFAMNDVTSRGAQVSFHARGRGGRHNPNAVRPKSKQK